MSNQVINDQPIKLPKSVAQSTLAPLMALVALCAFILSFNSLTGVAAAVGMQPAWFFPIAVDGIILVATFTIYVLDDAVWHELIVPWLFLFLFTGISVFGNAMHAIQHNGDVFDVSLACMIAATPAIALLCGMHLLMTIVRPKQKRRVRKTGEQRASERLVGASSGKTEKQILALIRAKVRNGKTVTADDMAKWLDVSRNTGARKLKMFQERHPEAFVPPTVPATAQTPEPIGWGAVQ